MNETYTTGEVAKLIGVSARTLYRWLYAHWLPEPDQVTVGRSKVRIWMPEDMKRAADLKVAMQRGRPRKDTETKVNKRLLDLDRQLAWYVNAGNLSDEERSAANTLLYGLKVRLVKAGLIW
jgi:excisionase family DNA binding protein